LFSVLITAIKVMLVVIMKVGMVAMKLVVLNLVTNVDT